MDPSVALGMREVLAGLEADPSAPAKEVLLRYTVTLETVYADSKNISLFIFGMRCFFCWPRAQELLKKPSDVKEVQEVWIAQNDRVYSNWLSSSEDSPEGLRWEKWCFQAKMSILKEFVDQAAGQASS